MAPWLHVPLVLIALALALVPAPPHGTGARRGADDASTRRGALRLEAEAILEERQSLEITASEALRRVELLLRELRAWASESDLELSLHSRAYTLEPDDEREALSAEDCPLFFKEDIEEVDDICPLDVARSEVWGASVVYCRYACAPSVGEEQTSEPGSRTSE